MPTLKNRVPSYRLHKASGKAVVTLGGIDHYLGSHGSNESRRAYDRLIGEWLANGRRSPQPTTIAGRHKRTDVRSVKRIFLLRR